MNTTHVCRMTAFGLVALALTGVTGCLSSSPQSRFYQLPLSSSTNAPLEVAGSRVVVIGPVVLAPYLTKPQVVTRLSDHELRYEETHRWSEPLRVGVPMVIYDLAQRQLAGARVVPFPFDSVTDADLQVTVGLLRLDGDAKGNVQLDARWNIRDPKRGVNLLQKHSRLEARAVDGSVAASVRVHGELIEQLTQSIIDEVRRALSQRPADASAAK